MTVLRADGRLGAARDRVFHFLEDPRLADRLNPDHLTTTVVEAPWIPRIGARTELRLVYRGTPFALTTELAEYRRGSFLLERQVTGPFLRFEHAVNLEDEGEATRVTEVLAYELHLGHLGRLFDRITLRRDLEAVLRHRTVRLRELLELTS